MIRQDEQSCAPSHSETERSFEVIQEVLCASHTLVLSSSHGLLNLVIDYLAYISKLFSSETKWCYHLLHFMKSCQDTAVRVELFPRRATYVWRVPVIIPSHNLKWPHVNGVFCLSEFPFNAISERKLALPWSENDESGIISFLCGINISVFKCHRQEVSCEYTSEC